VVSLNIMDALKAVVLSEETIWTDFWVSPYILVQNTSISTKSRLFSTGTELSFF